MGYSVYFPNGMLVKVDTAEEVVALRRAAGLALPSRPVAAAATEAIAMPGQPVESFDESWAKLCEILVTPRYTIDHKLLAVLKGHQDLTVAELMRVLAIDSPGGIGARIGHIGRACKTAGLPKELVIITVGKGGSKRYRPGPLLVRNELPPVPESTSG